MSYKVILENSIKSIFDDFEKMGGHIKNPSIIDRYLIAATYKAARLTNTLILLCENGKCEDALLILRSLIEHTVNMRWITTRDTKTRIKMYVNDISDKGFGAQWTDVNLYDRMKQISFEDKDYFDFCVKLTYSYAHVNALSLRWGEVYDDPRLRDDDWPPDAIYQVAAQMTGHVMLALNKNYKEYFKGYDRLWESIPVDKDIRKKYEEVKEKLKNER